MSKLLSGLCGLLLLFTSCHKAYLKTSRKLTAKGEQLIHASPATGSTVPAEHAQQALRYFEQAIALDPQNMDAYLGRASSLYYMGNDDRALSEFNKLVDIAPTAWQIYVKRALVQEALGNTVAAAADYRKAQSLSPDNYLPSYNLGVLYYRQNDFPQAVDFFSTAIDHGYNYPFVYYNRGKSHFDAKEYELALPDLTTAMEGDTGIKEAAFVERGDCYQNMEQHDKAVIDYTKALDRDPANYVALLGRSLSYAQLQQYDAAEQDYRRIIAIDPKDTYGYQAIATLYHQRGLYAESNRHFGLMLRIDSTKHDAYFGRSYNYYMLGDTAASIAELNTYLRFNPGRVDAYQQIAAIYHTWEKPQEAIRSYRQAWKASPSDSSLLYDKAYYEQTISFIDSSVADYHLILSRWPNYAKASFQLGRLYHHLQRSDSALLLFNKALALDPGLTDVYRFRGDLYRRIGQYEKAIADFDSVIVHDTAFHDAFTQRGLCLMKLKRYEEALPAMLEALHRCREQPTIIGEQRLYPEKAIHYNNLANCYHSLKRMADACANWKLALENGYNYKPEWKKEFGIDDPKLLLKKYCK